MDLQKERGLFNEFFKKKFKDLHESLCCGDLIAKKHKKALWQTWQAGAESRQAEIDELNKRIDDAMQYVSESPLKDVSRRAMLNFLDILKGKQND